MHNFQLVRGKDNAATKLIEYFDKNPQAEKEFSDSLAIHGIGADFKIAGAGGTGIFLESAEQGVVVGIRGNMLNHVNTLQQPIVRQPIPQHLQPLANYKVHNLDIEITPKISVSRDLAPVHILKDSIAGTAHSEVGQQWLFRDLEARNVGQSPQGTHYVLDGNAIESVALEKTASSDMAAAGHWINADGTWKQYKEFESLHAKFNSPLHQQGGKIGNFQSTVESAVENAVTGGSANKSWTAKVVEAENKTLKSAHSKKLVFAALGTVAVGSALLANHFYQKHKNEEASQTR